jgi:Ca-activated chloride channel family protein
MTMVDDRELRQLRDIDTPAPDADARARALAAAMAAYDENISASTAQGTGQSHMDLFEESKGEQTGIVARTNTPIFRLCSAYAIALAQGMGGRRRLIERAHTLWREIIQKKLIATPALAGLVALPIAGYAAFHLMDGVPFSRHGTEQIRETAVNGGGQPSAPPNAQKAVDQESRAPLQSESADTPAPAVAPAPMMKARNRTGVVPQSFASKTLMAEPAPVAPAGDMMPSRQGNRDRVEDFKTNPIHAVAEDPISTFSADVDTASYSYVRRSLKEGILPQADTVRVEEMINYFPYDWKGPASAATPFNTTVTVMPTPWNAGTKLMHVAIKGYDVQPATRPKANLVFLIDVSGSMDEPDKLPLLKSAFRMLVGKLGPDDTVSIVTYAGEAGTVLEPTKVSDKDKILRVIDTLSSGGSTAGEAGIREAYRLAEKSFVKGGVNRVMLATDGDFNVGQSSDDDLTRLIERERKSGVFLSVLGFGRGNLNDRMMQTIAQNGNGTAAYIDTLSEAQKVLVEEASSTLFPIAKDVKIQVEFNPRRVSEYRLIGYETRALDREDFNNDRVDAGDIGSRHSVTAIYEITPKGSEAEQIDPLRYGQASTANGGVANADEYAFVKVRYKLPDESASKLITTPVTAANEVASFDAAGTDQRFSVAVAAFGQKLRDEDATADFGYDRIEAMAADARGSDPFGYRGEFLSLVRLAAALDTSRP